MNRMLIMWAALLGCWVLSPRAHAQKSATELERARSLFKEAAELQAHEAWGRAAAKYRQAAAIKDTPGLRFRTGYCEIRQQRLLQAKREFTRAQRLLDHHPEADDVRRLLPKAMARLDARIPTLRVQLPEPVAAVQFMVNSQPVPAKRLGTALSLNPGVHSVLLRTPGGERFQQQVRLEDGDHVRLLARLTPASPAPHTSRTSAPIARPAPGGADPGDGVRPIALWSGVGLTAAGLATGLLQLWRERAAARRHDRHARPLDNGACRERNIDVDAHCTALQQALRDQQTARTHAGWAFVAAGAGAAITLTTLWLGEGTNVTTSAMFSPTGATLSLEGSL